MPQQTPQTARTASSSPSSSLGSQVVSWINTHRTAFSAWLLCGCASVWADFVAVFFLVTCLVLPFRNLGTRKAGEWSAYAAFNPDGIALPGTYTAEQLDRQLRNQPATLQRGEQPVLPPLPEEPLDARRSQLCPCGSGLKFKACCGSDRRPCHCGSLRQYKRCCMKEDDQWRAEQKRLREEHEAEQAHARLALRNPPPWALPRGVGL